MTLYERTVRYLFAALLGRGRGDRFPKFVSEAESMTRLIALAYDPKLQLTDSPNPDVVRLIGEALQCAYEDGLNDG